MQDWLKMHKGQFVPKESPWEKCANVRMCEFTNAALLDCEKW